jgi:hypothetical protein
MNNLEIFGIIAGILSFIAYLSYIVTILLGKTRPSRSTWWVLTLVGMLIASSYYAGGARTTIWIALSYVVGPFIIALLSLKYGEGKWERLDTYCFTGSIIGAVVWYVAHSALLGLIINIGIDFLGLIPTVKKSFLHPQGENRLAWTLELIASFLNMFAIDRWSFSIIIYPIYLLVMNGIIALSLYLPMFKKRNI